MVVGFIVLIINVTNMMMQSVLTSVFIFGEIINNLCGYFVFLDYSYPKID